MKIEIELPEIDGFEYTGEYKIPNIEDHYLDSSLNPNFAMEKICSPYPILKPIEKWIPANLEYIQEHYKWGEAVEVRIKDYGDDEWSFTNITYYDASEWDRIEIKEVKK
jgi:hypothetical protein